MAYKQVRTKWHSKYNSFNEIIAYSDIYELACKLGYDSAIKVWADNQIMQQSVIPELYCRIFAQDVQQKLHP